MVSRQTKRKQTNAKIEGKGNTKANKTRVGSKTKQTSPHIQSSQRRIDTTDTSKIAYVLDTNVILSAWDAIFKFEEHDVYIVDQVWSELDNNKKGYSDKAFHARKAIRVIDELIAGKPPEE